MKISVVVLAKNESSGIKDCIKSLEWADEAIVVNDFSSDDTAEKAKSLGATVLNRRLDNFANQWNFGISHAKNNWILTTAVDERLDGELRKELSKTNLSNFSACYLNYKNYFIGRRMTSLNERHLVLFNRTKASFTGDIHEHLEVTGPIKVIENGFIEHRSNPSMRKFLEKQNNYTDLEVSQIVKLSKVKLILGLTLIPLKTFLISYFKRGCFRDGIYGFVWSVYSAIYKINIYSKALEKFN